MLLSTLYLLVTLRTRVVNFIKCSSERTTSPHIHDYMIYLNILKCIKNERRYYVPDINNYEVKIIL